jgi:aldose 1-epimerase
MPGQSLPHRAARAKRRRAPLASGTVVGRAGRRHARGRDGVARTASVVSGGGLAPGGRPLVLSDGEHRAVITESGATLRAYDVGARQVIHPFAGPETPVIGCQGEVLAPWPNRVVDGRWTWRGVSYQLSITEPERGHALHGLVRGATWSVVEHRPDAVTLEVLLLAQPGWPFPLQCRVSYELAEGGLTSTLTSTNVGRAACPYGAAVHPYLALPGGLVDDAVLQVPAATWVETDERLAPVRRRPTIGTPYDLSGDAPIGGRQIDTAFTDVAVGTDGRVEARLLAPDGRTTVVWGDEAVRWWQVYTGDTLPPPWRRATVAVEPMTCAPDAFNSGDGVVVLEPGERHSMSWGVRLV